jgi:hypothetical protein
MTARSAIRSVALDPVSGAVVRPLDDFTTSDCVNMQNGTIERSIAPFECPGIAIAAVARGFDV